MDYKYIEQLIQRYFECQTTLQEEEILKAFFTQEEVPVKLLKYKDLFCYEQTQPQQEGLGEDFDEKIMRMIEEPKVVKAKTIKLSERLRPLFKAAAVVAIILSIGMAAQMPYYDGGQEQKVAALPGDTLKTGPSVAKIDSIQADSLLGSQTIIIK